MGKGLVVWLNGTSSAGKTSIAQALQGLMERPFVHTGVDHFLPRVPRQCFAVSDGHDPTATSDYFLLVYDGPASRTVDEREGGATVHSTTGRLVEVRIGPGGLRLLDGMYRGIAALAAGVDVVVDDVIQDPRVLALGVAALRETDTLFVGLRLPLAVAERREQERGDRGPGGAAAFFERVHAHARYDLELDTATHDPLACARQIKQALEGGSPRRAVRDLAERLSAPAAL